MIPIGWLLWCSHWCNSARGLAWISFIMHVRICASRTWSKNSLVPWESFTLFLTVLRHNWQANPLRDPGSLPTPSKACINTFSAFICSQNGAVIVSMKLMLWMLVWCYSQGSIGCVLLQTIRLSPLIHIPEFRTSLELNPTMWIICFTIDIVALINASFLMWVGNVP